MKKEKSDIRIRFTKKMIQESLVELMAEKSILKITISEICEHAGVSRSTFYTYYDDQYDLLKQIEDQIYRGMDHLAKNFNSALNKSGKINSVGLDEAIQGFLEYIADNNNSIQVLLSENGDYLFQKRFFQSNIENLRYYREVKGRNVVDDEALKCYSLFVVGGFIVLIQDWLKSNMSIPMPKMAKVIAGLMQGIISREKLFL